MANNGNEELSMLVVMGVTGAGKSYFINKLIGYEAVGEGDSLNSCTQSCQMIAATVGRKKVLIIDTPGFDDSKRSDTDILGEIAKVLTAQYELGVKLKGIIYVHRISDVRYQGSAVKTLQIFQKICGDMAMKNVTLVTSRWNDVPLNVGTKREKELKEQFWAYMVHKGSTMTRYYGDTESAEAIASQLLMKETVVLDLQRELIDQGKSLNETAAGAYVDNGLTQLKKKYQEELDELEKLKQELRDSDRAMKLQIQQDWAREQARLQEVRQQQLYLQQHTGQEVHQEIEKKKKKHSGLGLAMSFVPTALSVLGMFVGIPPGTFEILSGWLSGSGITDSITELLSSF